MVAVAMAENSKVIYKADDMQAYSAILIKKPSGNYDPNKNKELMDCGREALRDRYYSHKKKDTYCGWIKKCILMNYRRGLMLISVRCLDKLPETGNTLITKDMLPHKASFRCDIMRARKRDFAAYADRSNIC
jgi:hypothetical protein